MNIKGLTLDEISQRLKPCLESHFRGCTLSNNNLFAESYLFDFEEVQHLIPKEYHNYFKPTDKFNGASGFVEFDTVTETFRHNEYLALLVVSEDYSRAFLLALQETDKETGSIKVTILKDFLEGKDKPCLKKK